MIRPFRRLHLSPEAWVIAAIAVANVIFHLLLPEYGYHRDELYYVAIADGFSFANLDMPPGAPLYLKMFLMVFGHSLKVLHLAASVCGSIVIIFACLIAKEFGGKRYAVLLTGVFLMVSGLAIFGSLYTYDSLTFAVWAGVLYLLVRMFKGADQRLWLVAGVLLGVGMMTKLTILFLGLAIFLSLWLVKERRWFSRPWIWIGAAIALAGAIPYALWQKDHGWYFLSYASTYSQRVTHSSPVLDFVWNQGLPNNVALLPVWLIGLVALLFFKIWSPFRFFGYLYLVLCAAIFWLGGQFYFMLPIYAVLVAAGAVWIEQRLERGSTPEHPHLAAKIAIPAVIVMLAVPSLPFFVPMLPVDLLIRYLKPIGVTAGVKTEDRQITNLPQHMADRFGWEEMAQDIADVYHQEAGDSGGDIGIVARNWGQASAVHVYAKKCGLPEPVCTDGWFYFEGVRQRRFPDRFVSIGIPPGNLRTLFRHVEMKKLFTNPHCMPDEYNDEICYSSGPRVDLRQYWRVSHRIDPQFSALIRTEGVYRAADYFRRLRKEDPGAVLFTEQDMNRLGYRYLGEGKVKEAIVLFALNVEAYPESFNVYDSLGEAQMADGQYGPAVQNYERSLEINPANKNGLKKLEELRAHAGS
jgi:hypothetical protein